MITEKSSEVMTQDTLTDLVQSGFDESEVAVFFNLYQEKELFDGSFGRQLQKAGKDGIERVRTALGIETKIEQRGDLYFLVTKKNTYNNPNKEGTDGFDAKQKIKQIGAGYKAPAGYENFVFKDPYGEKAR